MTDNRQPMQPTNVAAYLTLKEANPDKVVGIQVGDYIMFYGKDAETVAPALGTKVLADTLQGMGFTKVTGSNLSWQSTLQKLVDHQISVALARQDPSHGNDGPYEVFKVRNLLQDLEQLSVEEFAARIYDITGRVYPELVAGTSRDEQIQLTSDCIQSKDTIDLMSLLLSIQQDGDPSASVEAEALLDHLFEAVREPDEMER